MLILRSPNMAGKTNYLVSHIICNTSNRGGEGEVELWPGHATHVLLITTLLHTATNCNQLSIYAHRLSHLIDFTSRTDRLKLAPCPAVVKQSDFYRFLCIEYALRIELKITLINVYPSIYPSCIYSISFMALYTRVTHAQAQSEIWNTLYHWHLLTSCQLVSQNSRARPAFAWMSSTCPCLPAF